MRKRQCRIGRRQAVAIIILGLLVMAAAVCIRLMAGYSAGGSEEAAADGLTDAWLNNPEAEEVTEEVCSDYSGTIDCVLEIPKINICRVVITGGNMQYNLDRHLFVTLDQTMVYRKCSYIIGGHQSWIDGYSMNRLEELEVGDTIYITKDNVTDTFIVTETVSEQWGVAKSDYGTDADRLAIYTCKKQHTRPKPYIVVRAERIEQ